MALDTLRRFLLVNIKPIETAYTIGTAQLYLTITNLSLSSLNMYITYQQLAIPAKKKPLNYFNIRELGSSQGWYGRKRLNSARQVNGGYCLYLTQHKQLSPYQSSCLWLYLALSSQDFARLRQSLYRSNSIYSSD